MSKEEYFVPDYVLTAFQNSLNTRHSYMRRLFAKQDARDARLSKWFTELSQKCGGEVTPEMVYYTLLKYNTTVYTPDRCHSCSNLLPVRHIRENRHFCSCHCAINSKEVQDKRKATMLKHFGTTNHFAAKEVRDKINATMIERYGVDNAAKSALIRSKTKAHLKERYGVENAFLIKEVQESLPDKIRYSKRKKYYEFFKESLDKLKNIELISTKEEYLAVRPLQFKCKNCGTIWVDDPNKSNYALVSCPHCIKSCVSQPENNLLAYIQSIYTGTIAVRTRKIISPLELDIYLPNKKVAFEFNGSYWHSDRCVHESNYHFQKTKMCNKQGIRLIHVFEYEWMYKQEKIKALIRSALGIFEKKIYARKCQVKSIDSKTYSEFLELYHLQGSVKSSIRYGLFYQDELVVVIGFGQSRFKKGELELHRYCVKSDYQIIGGFSKLIKHSCQENNIKEFISFIDLAHYNGRGYKKIGFTKVSVTKPSYVYVKGDQILSRIYCQKHKLKKLLGDQYNPDYTESQNMTLAGYYKIFDSGNLKVKYCA